MSGEYVAKLRRRALGFLKEAEEVGDPDLSAFFAEQSMQLYLKSVLYELFGEKVRGHGLRELLGHLSKLLNRHGYGGMADKIYSLVDKHRRNLILAEEAYIGGRYGDTGYAPEDAEILTKVAKELITLLDEVVKAVKLG